MSTTSIAPTVAPRMIHPRGTPPSNSIIMTNLSKIFFHPTLQAVLRSHLNSYGHTRLWTMLPEASKIIVVYSDPSSARLAKEEMDQLVFDELEIRELVVSLLDPRQEETRELLTGLESTLIKVYYGPHLPLSSTITPNRCARDAKTGASLDKWGGGEERPNGRDSLKPPNLDKNFLISPPGSPPVGWQQVVEEAPNQKDLADDLCQRLRFLSVGNEGEAEEGVSHPVQPSNDSSLNEIILLPERPHRHLPALKIQQVQAVQRSPGMDIHLVKATIESLRTLPAAKISPTPMPQIY